MFHPMCVCVCVCVPLLPAMPDSRTGNRGPVELGKGIDRHRFECPAPASAPPFVG